MVGAGAVGRYLGEALAATGADIVYAPRAIGDVVAVEADLAIVAVKAYDTAGAVQTLRRALGADSDAAILTPQNGVGNEEILASAFGPDRIVSGALTVPVEIDPEGRVVAANQGGLALAPVGSVSHNWLVAALERSAIPVRVSDDYRALKWSKLALNVIANASCAILDVLPERLVEMRAVFALEIRAIRETRSVMLQLGLAAIDLPRYPVRALFAAATLPLPLARLALARRIASGRGRKPPSLLLDLRAGGGRTEVAMLSGAVAAAGCTAGVPTPVSAAFARVLGEIAHSPELWPKYRERPEALLAEVMGGETDVHQG